MSYRPTPSYRPNASLIHELRMIAQSFFAHRTSASIFGSRRESTSLLCVDCVRARNIRPQKAMVIDNGRSVCQTHFKL